MKKTVNLFWVILCLCLPAELVKADLLGVNPSYPQIDFVNTDPMAVSYDPGTQVLSINATPFNIFLSELDSGSLIVSNNTLQIQLDTDGNMVTGTNGFILTGQFTEVVGGVTNTYSGTLLQGDV